MSKIIRLILSSILFCFSAHAQEITVTTLPPAGAMEADELAIAVEQALLEAERSNQTILLDEDAGSQSTGGVTFEIAPKAVEPEAQTGGVSFVIDPRDDETQEADEALETITFSTNTLNFDPLPEDHFDYAKFNSLRNVRRYDASSERVFKINGTSNRILDIIESDPFLFTNLNGLKFFSDAKKMAPVVVTNGDGTKSFPDLSDASSRRKNVIFSAYYESVREISAQRYPQADMIQDVYQADLLLFSHLESSGAFFTRVKVEVDWSDLAGSEKGVVKVISEPLHISLNDTDFEVYADLSQHKTVMKDRSENNITLVFGVTTGGYDNRSSADGVVGSLTLQMPPTLFSQSQRYSEPEAEIQDFDIETSFLVKQSVAPNAGWNTSARIEPDYYQARPFRAILDFRFVERDAEGKIINYGAGYRQVGFHHEIESEGIIRAAYSNGCVRTTDPDLYTLDAIVDYGPKDHVPVSVKMVQAEFTNLESVIPLRTNLYRQVKLQAKTNSPNTAEVVMCKLNSSSSIKSYNVKSYRSSNGEEYRTMVETTCLTAMDKIEQSPNNIVSYIIDKRENGRSNISAPASSIVSTQNLHRPIRIRRGVLIENYDLLPLLDDSLSSINARDSYISNYSRQTQIDKIGLIARLRNGDYQDVESFQFQAIDPFYIYLSENLRLVKTRSDRDIFRRNAPWYAINCPNQDNPHPSCQPALDRLSEAYQRYVNQ